MERRGEETDWKSGVRRGGGWERRESEEREVGEGREIVKRERVVEGEKEGEKGGGRGRE